jgi:pyruvate dehydrogenase (quinone)
MAGTVADMLVDTLAAAGVKRIYGIVGDSLNPVTDAVRRDGRIQWVHVRHEEAGAFAAGAEAQLSGELVVCAGTSGPGNLHLINGLYDCQRSHAPVLAIASHIPSSEIGTGYFQETHPTLLFQECSHYCELIANPKQMPRILQIAMQTAVSRRGVAVVVLPGDVSGLPAPDGELAHGLATPHPIVRPADAELQQLADRLNASSKITIFAGAGCADAHDEVVALAEKLKAPVGFAYGGKSFVEYDNPYEVGMTGLLGYGGAYKAMHDCDLLLLLGTDFPYEAFLPANAAIVQVDIRAERLGARSRLDLGLSGDIKGTLTALLPLLREKRETAHLDTARQEHALALRKLEVYVEHVSERRPIHPEYLAASLNAFAAPDAIFTVDTGTPNIWSARYLRTTRGRRIIGSLSHGSMACALPQAIGAQLLHPGRQVISLSGDGGLSMLLGELITMAQYKLPIKVVVFDNDALAFIQLEMEAAGFPPWQTDLHNPDFARMAEAMGILGVRIEQPQDLSDGLQRALAHDGPAVIDVLVEPNALALPPHITLGQAEGFALAMTKEVLIGRYADVVDTVTGNLQLRP